MSEFFHKVLVPVAAGAALMALGWANSLQTEVVTLKVEKAYQRGQLERIENKIDQISVQVVDLQRQIDRTGR